LKRFQEILNHDDFSDGEDVGLAEPRVQQIGGFDDRQGAEISHRPHRRDCCRKPETHLLWQGSSGLDLLSICARLHHYLCDWLLRRRDTL
jgi:hypothetical protein